MLQHLSVNNYALINNVEVDFESGLTIITGETGAGKSILLGALGLLLGQRAESQILWNKEKKCIIEGVFDIQNLSLELFFSSNELDFDPQLIIRREIQPTGKSRAFVNDTPVSLQLLKDLGNNLIDIHSQHETLNLQNSGFQTSLLDSFAKSSDLQKEYSKLYSDYKRKLLQLGEMEDAAQKAKAETDYISFLINELSELKISENEDSKLEQELEILTHSNEIASGIQKALQILNGEGLSLLHLIREQRQTINTLEKFNPEFSGVTERIKSCEIEFKDISEELEAMESKLVFNPDRINEINARLDKIYSAFQKHRVNSASELIKKTEDLSEKLAQLESIDNEVRLLSQKIAETEDQLHKLAKSINEKRKKNSPLFEKAVTSILKDLSMPDCTFITEIQSTENIAAFGYDKVGFLFSSNKGHQPGDISKVASGGELSRLMLALKSLITEENMLPTIIFDEIDTGISGSVAGKVANVLNNLSKSKQVIAITHLPQIAAAGKTHLYVYKEKTDDTTHSMIRKLSQKERLVEIGTMLSNDKLTDAALKQAQELVNSY